MLRLIGSKIQMKNWYRFQKFWIRANASFLVRYWTTANTALERVKNDPSTYEEFQVNGAESNYVEAVISSHREFHCYSGLLITYAMLDEFLTILIKNLRQLHNVPLQLSEVKDRGVRRYERYILDECAIAGSELNVDWNFLKDFSVVRNAIIHANGNKSLLSESQKHKLEAVVKRYPGELSFKYDAKLVVENVFIERCIGKTVESATKINSYLSSKV